LFRNIRLAYACVTVAQSSEALMTLTVAPYELASSHVTQIHPAIA
jgi:hypothetical protein